MPTVYISTVPAELLLTQGQPQFTPILGTTLLYVSNSGNDVFMDSSNNNYYILLAGRWFLLGKGEMLGGRMTIGDYVAFNAYLIYLSGPVQTLTTFHLGVQPSFASLGRLMELFRMSTEFGAAGRSGGLRPVSLRGLLEFRDVTFAYQEGPPVLRDIRFTVAPGAADAT